MGDNQTIQNVQLQELTSHLSLKERRLLAQHEKTIEKNLHAFLVTGIALTQIKQGMLFRETHDTFEEYLTDRWQMVGRAYAYRLISAARVFKNLEDGLPAPKTKNLSPVGELSIKVLPETERQIRPLAKLDPEKQNKAWQLAVVRSKGKQPPAYMIERVVDEMTEDEKVIHQRVSQEIAARKSDKIRQKRLTKLEQICRSNLPSLNKIGKFPIILCDPAWEYRHSRSEQRNIANQYPSVSFDKLLKLPVKTAATKDAVLYLWATSPLLNQAMTLLTKWGFEYKTSLVWVKTCKTKAALAPGMGYWARSEHELILIGTKGKMITPHPSSRPGSVLFSPKGKHSEKPLLYSLLDRLYPTLPKLELFSREKQQRKCWTYWGFESLVALNDK